MRMTAGCTPGSFDELRLYRVARPSTVNRSSITIRRGVVHARHELAHPDAAELPIGELRRSVGRSVFSAGHAEHRGLRHLGVDRLAFRRAGGAARQDLQRPPRVRLRRAVGCGRRAPGPPTEVTVGRAATATPALPARLAAAITRGVQSSWSATTAAIRAFRCRARSPPATRTSRSSRP